jgi:hypothetical protein
MLRFPALDALLEDVVDEETGAISGSSLDSIGYAVLLEAQGISEESLVARERFLSEGKWAAGYTNIEVAIASAADPDPVPEVGTLSDGRSLFYAAEVNYLYGTHSAAKTWIMLLISKQVMESGQNVLYLDFEDSGKKAVKKLLKLGIDPALLRRHFHHVRPPSGGASEQLWLRAFVESRSINLCVIDTVGIALGIEGSDSNHDSDVAAWLAKFPNFLAELGVCVVLVDHLAKTALDDRNPTGSGRKLQSVSGAAYLTKVVTGAPFGKGKAGKAVLTCKKDRQGFYSIDEKVAVFTLDGTTDSERPTATLTPARSDEETAVTKKELQDATVWAARRALDKLGVPETAGFPTCSRALPPGQFTKTVIQKAVKERKSWAAKGRGADELAASSVSNDSGASSERVGFSFERVADD